MLAGIAHSYHSLESQAKLILASFSTHLTMSRVLTAILSYRFWQLMRRSFKKNSRLPWNFKEKPEDARLRWNFKQEPRPRKIEIAWQLLAEKRQQSLKAYLEAYCDRWQKLGKKQQDCLDREIGVTNSGNALQNSTTHSAKAVMLSFNLHNTLRLRHQNYWRSFLTGYNDLIYPSLDGKPRNYFL